jgi:hypothetical protein
MGWQGFGELKIMDKPSDFALPHQGAIETRIGQALILMFEPHAGHEQAYNRWYEDDHFYVAGRAAPWVFAGRRWVAPRPLQMLRVPENSPLAQPVTAGCYLSLAFVIAGHAREFQDWATVMLERLRGVNRTFAQRSHVFSTFQDYSGAVYRDAKGPRDIHALDYPYAGVVVEVVEAKAEQTQEQLYEWLVRDHIPAKLRGSPIAQCLIFFEPSTPGTMLDRADRDKPGSKPRITLLWFLEAAPQTHWNELFAGEEAFVSNAGHGRLLLAAPFIPTLPGTDIYVDELR